MTLLSTFLFSLHLYFPGVHFYGIGFIMNIPTFFTSGDILVIIMATVFILFLLSGIFILIGIKSRSLAIIGSILAIVAGVYFILVFYMGIIEIDQFAFMFLNFSLIEGIIPFNIPIGTISIAPSLILAGGLLGLIGGINRSGW
ncbi:hypothetical protein LCGC14_1322960 [marine sediment metagenome]|uniref:Uncharacterized protein n=1 Tax=marine sediment metagenome TaxID=412755 RepID=A0A0F9KIZ0_9ZZZZ